MKERIAASIPGATFEDHETFRFPMTEEQKAAVQHKVALGIPNMAIFSIGARTELNPTPTDGHLWFAPIIPKTGEAVLESQRVMANVYREFGLNFGGIFQTPATWIFRNFAMIVGMPERDTRK
jgi:4-cresol dehydrogenase (hydroxylating)